MDRDEPESGWSYIKELVDVKEENERSGYACEHTTERISRTDARGIVWYTDDPSAKERYQEQVPGE